MRIAIVSPYSWARAGGVNNHVFGLTEALQERGHRVTVLAPDAGAVPEGASFVSAGRSLPFPANGSISWISVMPGTTGRVRRGLAGDFDAVHVHEPLVPLVSAAAVRASECTTVGTFHAAGEGRSIAYGAGRFFYGDVVRRLDRRIAVSRSAAESISRYFPGGYEIVPNGIRYGWFAAERPRPEGFPEGKGPFVLFVGRNEPRKGLPVLLDAFRRVVEIEPGAGLVLVGSGLDRDEVLKEVEPGIRSRIASPGFVPDEQLPAYYGHSDVFCSPAIGGESFGIVLIEAMAAGTPVVASKIPGYVDVVDGTGGGLLFEAGDPSSLAEALLRLIQDRVLAERLSENGRLNTRQFDWNSLAVRLESIYSG